MTNYKHASKIYDELKDQFSISVHTDLSGDKRISLIDLIVSVNGMKINQSELEYLEFRLSGDQCRE
jgi:hypothetical protein